MTLVSIEAGERPLRLSEAVDLAQVLQTHVHLFFEPTGHVAWNEAHSNVRMAQREFDLAVHEYGLAVFRAVEHLGDVELSETQEKELADAVLVSPFDIAARQDNEDVLTLIDNIHEDPMGVPYTDAERVERNGRRLKPFADRWHAQVQIIREAGVRGEYSEAP